MTTTAGVARPRAHTVSETYAEHPVVRPGRTPYVFSGLLTAVAATAAACSFFFPSLLTGVKVANGNMRGTALVVLVVGLPVLVMAMVTTARGSARGLVVWLGTLAYLLYQAVLFCFATPLNNLFLIYVAYLGLGVWSLVVLLRATELRVFQSRVSTRMPARSLAAFCLVLVVLNAGAWLGQIVPAVLSRHPATLLEGTGLLTNAVFVQDLAIWLPVLAASAVAAWRRETWGLLVAGAMLAMFVLESVGVATDQWFGSHADPGRPARRWRWCRRSRFSPWSARFPSASFSARFGPRPTPDRSIVTPRRNFREIVGSAVPRPRPRSFREIVANEARERTPIPYRRQEFGPTLCLPPLLR